MYEESFARPLMMPERLVKSRREELRVGKKGFLDMFRFSRLIDVDVSLRESIRVSTAWICLSEREATRCVRVRFSAD